jgi:hypothetical protein
MIILPIYNLDKKILKKWQNIYLIIKNLAKFVVVIIILKDKDFLLWRSC